MLWSILFCCKLCNSNIKLFILLWYYSLVRMNYPQSFFFNQSLHLHDAESDQRCRLVFLTTATWKAKLLKLAQPPGLEERTRVRWGAAISPSDRKHSSGHGEQKTKEPFPKAKENTKSTFTPLGLGSTVITGVSQVHLILLMNSFEKRF